MVRLLETDIIEASKKGMDAFLDLFVDAYWKELGGDLTAESMGRLNGHQNALLPFKKTDIYLISSVGVLYIIIFC